MVPNNDTLYWYPMLLSYTGSLYWFLILLPYTGTLS
jgi:hypothetical protein